MKTNIVADPASQEITITREFEASTDLVFLAHSSPELFVRWYGCRDIVTTILNFDVRSGGIYEYQQHLSDGTRFTVRGVYHDVIAPKRIVKTVELLAHPGRVSLETVSFDALTPGRCIVSTHTVFQSVADRNRMLEAGVTKGAVETFDRLEKILETLKCQM